MKTIGDPISVTNDFLKTMLQDLTWVDEHILALHFSQNQLFLERWLDCEDNEHRFIMFTFSKKRFLGYLNHLTSLRQLIITCPTNIFVIRDSLNEQHSFYRITKEDLPPEYLPPENSFLPLNTTFLNETTLKTVMEFLKTEIAEFKQLNLSKLNNTQQFLKWVST